MDTVPIVDSHIHLYAQNHLSRLNWTAGLPSDHILNRQNSVDEYRAAVANQSSRLRGFVFVETDRKYRLDESGWTDALEEVSFLARIAQGQPLPGEGHEAGDARLVLGIVPWAPLPGGRMALEKYVAQVKAACGDEETFKLVKGFRYLLQDKPSGTGLDEAFLEGLAWLGEHGFTFDLGVDVRQRGLKQLDEAIQMLLSLQQQQQQQQQQTKGSGGELKVIVNHFCKPNLRLDTGPVAQMDHEDFVAWRQAIRSLAGCPNTYMKLSGFFSELPPQDEEKPASIPHLAERVRPWFDVVLDCFGPSRIMFGSDWPVCCAGGPGSKSWQHWVDLVAALLDEKALSSGQKRRVWSETAMDAYNLEI